MGETPLNEENIRPQDLLLAIDTDALDRYRAVAARLGVTLRVWPHASPEDYNHFFESNERHEITHHKRMGTESHITPQQMAAFHCARQSLLLQMSPPEDSPEGLAPFWEEYRRQA